MSPRGSASIIAFHSAPLATPASALGARSYMACNDTAALWPAAAITRSEPASSPSSRTVPKVSRATWANSPADGDAVPPKNTPSPTALAAATPFGPAAATRMGTSTGRAGAKPAGCIMRITEPSHATSSPRSSVRSAST